MTTRGRGRRPRPDPLPEFDEPTNHLDIPAIEELERSLAAYPGALLLATHDRRLLERIGLTRTVDLPTRLY